MKITDKQAQFIGSFMVVILLVFVGWGIAWGINQLFYRLGDTDSGPETAHHPEKFQWTVDTKPSHIGDIKLYEYGQDTIKIYAYNFRRLMKNTNAVIIVYIQSADRRLEIRQDNYMEGL